MRIIPTVAVTVAVAIAAVGCSNASTPASSTTTVASTVATAPASDTPECLAGELPFIPDGVVAVLDSEGRDARAIGDIRWIPTPSCERVEVSFLSRAGAPASSIGPVDVSILPDAGIVRVTLSGDVVETSVADTTLDGTIADRWYVIDGLADGLVIDFHLGTRAAARAFSTESPAMLVIDLVPTDDDRPITPAAVEDGFVLLSPQPGVGLYPLRIAGYAAPDVDAVRIRITDQAGIAIDRSISTLSAVYAWHAFEATLDDGPSGTVNLFVGSVDENDDPAAGIDLPLDLP